jgi:DNA-directed RNA polymerase beta' subunit
MFLELLNIENFIKSNNVLEVKSGKYPSSKGYDEDGLWSETIFGKLGTRNRKQQFGYVDLKTNFIHPVVFKLLRSSSDSISKIIREKAKYKITNKSLVEDNINGETGLSFLIREFENIDFRLNSHSDKKQESEFIESNKKIILINKFLILPAGDRDINLNDLNSIAKTSEINEVYRSLLFQISSLSGNEDLDNLVKNNIQNQLMKISDFIRDRYLKGKKGLIRNNMMKKSMDFTLRIVLTSSPNVPLGSISIPWHSALAIFEPLVSYNLFKKENDILPDIQSFAQKEFFDTHDLIKFFDDLVKNPTNVPPSLKTKLFNLITEITKDQVVLCKRDPVLQRNSYFSAHVLIHDGRVAILNSLDLPQLGADCDGDTVAIIPIFTEEAKKEALDNMNPYYTKSKLTDSKSISNVLYAPTLDAIATIYRATKDHA